MGGQRFEFKRLEAYRVALSFYGWALVIAARLERTDPGLGDQLLRAARSTVLNTAEAAGSWRPGNKRQHYAIARASTFETAAALDLLLIGKHISREAFDEREEELAEVGARLTRLCQRFDRGHATGK